MQLKEALILKKLFLRSLLKWHPFPMMALRMLNQEQDPEKVKVCQKEIAEIPAEQIAYADETGIDTYLYREYGYTPPSVARHSLLMLRKSMGFA